MNGRTYDPWLGRFVQPDPVVQDAMNGQNLNRYSYVLNNPMRYTDPSGYYWFDGSWSDIRFVALSSSYRWTGTISSTGYFRVPADYVRDQNAWSVNIVLSNLAAGTVPTAFSKFKIGETDENLQTTDVGVAIVGNTFSEQTGGSFINGGNANSLSWAQGESLRDLARKAEAVLGVFVQQGQNTPQGAAKAGLDAINPISQKEDSEYGFAVFAQSENGKTKFYYSIFVTDHSPDIIANIYRSLEHVPSGSRVVGVAHTHPGTDRYPGRDDQRVVSGPSAGPALGLSERAGGIYGWIAGKSGIVYEITPWGDIVEWEARVLTE